MTVVWHPREDWTTTIPVTGPDFPVWSEITDGIVVHYPGHNNLPTSPVGVPRHLRESHADYVNRRGYSYGYNFVIDPFGEVWQVRGWDFRNAANKGTNDKSDPRYRPYNVNYKTISVQVMYPVDGAVNDSQMVALRDFVDVIWGLAGRELDVTVHQDWDKTSCCGADLIARIKNEEYKPIDIPEEYMNATFRLKGYADVVHVVDCVPMPVSQELAKDIGLWPAVQEAIKNPIPHHEGVRRWLENQFGYALTKTPNGI